MALMRDLNRDGLTLVLVTHDPAIGKTASRLVRMRDGRIETEVEK
jgi:predicted ABC-type transport system involved in lysophospholipase L1 biosynthesis ATPase subunit